MNAEIRKHLNDLQALAEELNKRRDEVRTAVRFWAENSKFEKVLALYKAGLAYDDEH